MSSPKLTKLLRLWVHDVQTRQMHEVGTESVLLTRDLTRKSLTRRARRRPDLVVERCETQTPPKGLIGLYQHRGSDAMTHDPTWPDLDLWPLTWSEDLFPPVGGTRLLHHNLQQSELWRLRFRLGIETPHDHWPVPSIIIKDERYSSG